MIVDPAARPVTTPAAETLAIAGFATWNFDCEVTFCVDRSVSVVVTVSCDVPPSVGDTPVTTMKSGTAGCTANLAPHAVRERPTISAIANARRGEACPDRSGGG